MSRRAVVRVVEITAAYRLASANGVVPLTRTLLFGARNRRVGRAKGGFGP
jgi:hypothetical protein